MVSSKRIGFTLVELLVVIAIIALLLSILMPALNKVKEEGRFVVCLSNATQLGKATMLYTMDYSGSYPDELVWDDETGWVRSDDEIGPNGKKPFFWDDRLLPYVGNQWKVFLCPSVMVEQRDLAQAADSENPNAESRGHHIRTYKLNAYLGGYRFSQAQILGGDQFLYGPAMRVMQIKQPASVTMFTDVAVHGFADYWGSFFRSFTDCPPWHEMVYKGPQVDPYFWPYGPWGYRQRTGRSPWVFADGHAEKIFRDYSNNMVMFNNSYWWTYCAPPRSDMWINPNDPLDLYGH